MIRRQLPLMLLLVGAFLVFLRVGQPPPHPDALSYPPLAFTPPVIAPVRLDNGITLYLLEDHELPLVEVTALVGGGDINDAPEKTGQGVLFASLLAEGGAGPRDPDAFAELVEEHAIDLSVSTDAYATVLEMSLLAADLDTGLELLDDLLRRPRFDAERMEILRRQMLERVRRQDDLPGGIADRQLQTAIYGSHPFGRRPTMATVSALTRPDLLAFHRRHFVPDNLYLAISGDFDGNALREKLQARFGDWPSAGYQPDAVPGLTPGDEPAIWLAEKDLPQTTVLMGMVGIDKDDPDLHAVRLMNFILGGGGFNSRLMREIRSSRGLAYSVYSYYAIGRRLPGTFVAGGETASDSTLEMVQLMLDEMGRMTREPVSDQELALAKESLVNSFVFAFDDPHAVLTQKMRLDFYQYPPDYLESYRERVQAVTVDDILRVAREHLKPQLLSIVLVGRTAAFSVEAARFGRPVRRVPTTAADRAKGGGS